MVDAMCMLLQVVMRNHCKAWCDSREVVIILEIKPGGLGANKSPLVLSNCLGSILEADVALCKLKAWVLDVPPADNTVISHAPGAVAPPPPPPPSPPPPVLCGPHRGSRSRSKDAAAAIAAAAAAAAAGGEGRHEPVEGAVWRCLRTFTLVEGRVVRSRASGFELDQVATARGIKAVVAACAEKEDALFQRHMVDDEAMSDDSDDEKGDGDDGNDDGDDGNDDGEKGDKGGSGSGNGSGGGSGSGGGGGRDGGSTDCASSGEEE
jgi:hypothetical protein